MPADLIKQIEERCSSITSALRLETENNCTRYYDLAKLITYKKEIFILQYYFLLLVDMKPDEQTSQDQINEVLPQVTKLLKELYTRSNSKAIFSVQELEQQQKASADFCLVNAAKDNDIALLEAALKTGAFADDFNEEFAEEYKSAFSKAYQIKEMKPSITLLNSKLEEQKKRFKNNARSCFDFFLGNAKKAAELEAAMARAQANISTQVSLRDYLHAQVDGQKSIMDVLSKHRFGFSGKTRSQEEIEQAVDELLNTPVLAGS